MNNRLSRYLICQLIVLAFILILSGCASNDMYRNKYALCAYKQSGDCPTSALQIRSPDGSDEYRLGIVEYDDQGQLRDPIQMNAVLNEYRKIAGTEDVLLITFVHGWHHNAKPEDSNILSFRSLLSRLSEMEGLGSQQQGRPKRKILGLYIGWRGESIDIPLIKSLTFWERKNTAHNVGLEGVSELLLKLEEIVNVKTGLEQENPPPAYSRLVVIGHSFGGAVVFTSLQNILVDRYINSHQGKIFQDTADGFGDLVVLMNPAFEALRYSTLYNLSQEACRHYFSAQLPKLAILTSETDYSTKYLFSIGRIFSTLFESHTSLQRHYCTASGSSGIQSMDISEGEADRTTIGHYAPYVTHRLEPTDTMVPRAKNYQIAQIQSAWTQQKRAGKLDFVGSSLTSLGRTDPLNPYLNIQVSKDLMDGHNDIWGDAILSFMRDFITISTTPTGTNQ